MSRIQDYEKQYMNDYGFEKVMVWARQKYLEQLVRDLQPRVVMEIGCGFDQLFTRVADVNSIISWTIVEPANLFSYMAREKLKNDGRVKVIKGFVEDVVSDDKYQNVDLCICAGLLHEVENPKTIINVARKTLNNTGVLHLSVPNAKSFHRLLAVEMGLIDSPFQFSDRNITLSQYHVFDADTFKSLVLDLDVMVFDEGGYFIKPFTHSQMTKVIDELGGDLIDGLYYMGVKYPDLASEIYLNVMRKS